MSQDIVSIFNQERAANYDTQATMFGWREGFSELMLHIFGLLPADARILCVGVGTGLELEPMARAKPGWRFLALDPSAPMLDLCRRRMREAGAYERCEFFNGYLEELPAEREFDGATCVLVSQFMTEASAREEFFRQIARRLRTGGVFINCDLASDQDSPEYEALAEVWFRGLQATGATEEQVAQMKSAYRSMVAIRPPGEIQQLLESAGFSGATLFFQALLLHGWFATARDR